MEHRPARPSRISESRFLPLLRGWDIALWSRVVHVHSAPDVFGRSMDDEEMAAL
jgi:hypothetical protein